MHEEADMCELIRSLIHNGFFKKELPGGAVSQEA
jgi:hypothetical protein